MCRWHVYSFRSLKVKKTSKETSWSSSGSNGRSSGGIGDQSSFFGSDTGSIIIISIVVLGVVSTMSKTTSSDEGIRTEAATLESRNSSKEFDKIQLISVLEDISDFFAFFNSCDRVVKTDFLYFLVDSLSGFRKTRNNFIGFGNFALDKVVDTGSPLIEFLLEQRFGLCNILKIYFDIIVLSSDPCFFFGFDFGLSVIEVSLDLEPFLQILFGDVRINQEGRERKSFSMRRGNGSGIGLRKRLQEFEEFQRIQT